MKICLFDPNIYKFTRDIIASFEAEGHEVRHDHYYDPELVKWADTVWFETCDNNLHQATQETINGETAETVKLKDKRVIVRVIDIEAWKGLHKQVNWEYVDDVIFIAEHIKNLVLMDVMLPTTHVIPCGVNCNTFTMRKEPKNTKKIAWVAERWHAKGIDYFLQYGAILNKIAPDYKIYALGIWADDAAKEWYEAYIKYFLRHNKINVEFIDSVPDMNEFLEDKSHAICFSKKEAFSYAIAEGMSKGMKPIIHNFYGADTIWPEKYRWDTVDTAINMTIDKEYKPEEYRKYVVDTYSHKIMMESFKEVIDGKKGS